MTRPLHEEERQIVRDQIAKLTVRHRQNVERLDKEFEKERKRLRAMLESGIVPQMLST